MVRQVVLSETSVLLADMCVCALQFTLPLIQIWPKTQTRRQKREVYDV